MKTYIINRIAFLEQEREPEMLKAPESERGFLQEKFMGRIIELKKLKESLGKDLIKEDSKKYTDENNVMGILNHEIMHVIFYKIEKYRAYSRFDRLDNKEKAWFE